MNDRNNTQVTENCIIVDLICTQTFL